MLVRIVRLHIRPEEVARFLSYFNQAKFSIRNFNGCRFLQLLHDSSHPNIFFTISHWESTIHLQDYQQSEIFKNTWSRVKPLFAEKAQAWSLTVHDDVK